MRLGPTDQDTRYSPITESQVDPNVGGDAASYSGSAIEGETITAAGRIESYGLPVTTTYKFERLNPNAAPTLLQDGTDATYVLQSAGTGHEVRVEVDHTVWRADEQAIVSTETHDVTTPPVGERVTNDAPPTIDGMTRAGSTLTADPGTWHGGGGPLTYSYQWDSCAGGDCDAITSANASTYKLRAEDVGSTGATTLTPFSWRQSLRSLSQVQAVRSEPITSRRRPWSSRSARDPASDGRERN